MGFSSGTFTYTGSSTSFSAPVTGTTISSTAAAAAFTETATGLSTCLLKDGTQTSTAAIPLAIAPSALTHATRVTEVQNGYGSFLTSVAGTNTITGTATPTPAYTVGQRFTFVPAVTNTGATTLNISSLGAGAVQLAGAALTGGELVASVPVTVYVTAATPVFEIITPTQFPDSRALVVGATDSTKKVRFEADSITTGTTRVLTVQDRDMTIGVVSGTSTATTSGMSHSFTIPSWARKITFSLIDVSADGTADIMLRIGDAGGLEESGYLGAVITTGAAAAATANLGTSFILVDTSVAANSYSGQITLVLENAATFTWSCHGGVANNDATSAYVVMGHKALSAALTSVAIVSTDTFDAGEVNVVYE